MSLLLVARRELDRRLHCDILGEGFTNCVNSSRWSGYAPSRIHQMRIRQQAHQGRPNLAPARIVCGGLPATRLLYAAPCTFAESKTMSSRVPLTIAFSSACSAAGTANLSNVC